MAIGNAWLSARGRPFLLPPYCPNASLADYEAGVVVSICTKPRSTNDAQAASRSARNCCTPVSMPLNRREANRRGVIVSAETADTAIPQERSPKELIPEVKARSAPEAAALIGEHPAPVIAAVLARFLPKTTLFRQMVSQTASGEVSVGTQEAQLSARIGKTGVAIVPLCPGGKARFDDELLDVITRGEMVAKGQPVKIVGHTGANVIVQEVDGNA